MAREFVPCIKERDRVVNNHGHGLPIPPTVAQVMAAYHAIDEHCARSPHLLDRKGLRLKLLEEMQRVMQGMPTGDLYTAVVMRICRQYLNGFAAMS